MKIAVIDLDSVAYSIGNGVKLLGEDGLPIREDGKRFVYRDKTDEELVQSCNEVMNSILTASGATHYCGFIKGENTTIERLKINPQYKANRSSTPPHWWERVKELLITNWGAVVAHNYEVDDYVNVTRLMLPDSFICAIDGDLLELTGNHYNWRTGTWHLNTKNNERLKFWKDMIVGQKGDNIHGLVGKGEAFWKKVIVMDRVLDSVQLMLLPSQVLQAYITDLGVDQGIKDFYMNYSSLKILESIPGFTPPQPIPYKTKQENLIENLFK